MKIVDTHTHVVSPDEERYPLQPAGLPGRWYLEAPHSAADLAALMEEAGVARAVLVQGVGAYSYDNRYVADAAEDSPDRFWSACCVDPTAADAPDRLREWVVDRGMEGVRFFAIETGKDPSWLARSEGEALWETADALGVHVIVTLLAHQLGELDAVLSRWPRVPVSLDHCGFPPIATDGERALDPLRGLAHHEQLHLKVSTHVLDAAETKGALTAVLARLLDDFGAGRLMWGSDFCQTHDRPYARLVDLGLRACESWPSSEAQRFLADTAESIWDGARVRRGPRAPGA